MENTTPAPTAPATQPGTDQGGATQPSTGQPTTDQGGTTQPTTQPAQPSQPNTGQPNTGQPTTGTRPTIPTTPIAPAPPAVEDKKTEPRCVVDPQVRGASQGVLNWGFKRSFYGYILSNTGGKGAGKITPRAGASLNGGTFAFPVSHPGSMVNVANKTGRVNFAGNVNFYKHNGVLNLTLSSPSLVLTSPTTGYLEVSVSSTDMTGKPVVPGRVRFANVTFANTQITKDKLSVSTSSVTLTAQGAQAFAGFYKAGEVLDNFTVNTGLGEKVTCYDANGNPILADTGVDTTSTIIVMFALIGLGVVSLSARARNRK